MDFCAISSRYNLFTIKMITDLFLLIIAWLISAISFLLPNIHILPDEFTTAVTYLINVFTSFDFLFPVAGILKLITFFIYFEGLYFTGRLVVSIINFFRGAGRIEI